MNQTNAILQHLQKGEKITAIDALEKFKCFRLAARINDLKKRAQEQLPLVDWNKFLSKEEK